MKKIHIHYINRIKTCLRKIFEAEDTDYVDGRVVSANNKAIEHWLDKANITDPVERKELMDNIDWCWDNCAGNLEKLGWEIIRGKENL